jgi:pimeloyl-ACP methyl ester carboxylesterase
MRRTGALIGSVLAALVSTSPAAATTLPCAGGSSQCTRVSVPFDRAAGTGRVSLHVQRIPSTAPGAGTLIVLPGGPGQSASARLLELRGALGPAVRRRWTIVVFDPRGTGRSDVVLCPALQADTTLRSTEAAAACAQRLAGRRSHYTTWDNIQDLEAVRVSLGVDRVALYGTSYGTRVATGYAAAYPHHVDRVVIDSAVAPDGPSGIALESFAAMRRILGRLCPRRCHAVTRGLMAETTALVAQLRLRAMAGATYDAQGRRRPSSIDALGLLDLLFATDRKPELREGLAVAITSARHGDPAALLRLAAAARIVRLEQPPVFSAGVYAATNCTELRAPWDPAAALSARLGQVASSLDAVGDAAFLPFDRQTALSGGLVPLCLGWPTATAPPVAVAWQPIAAPMLILAGGQDVRAPLENARRIAARIPTASVLVVPSAGHSVFGTDAGGCATKAVLGFLVEHRRPRPCARGGPSAPAEPPPTALAALRPVPSVGGRPGRTLRALELTLDDVAFALALSSSGRGGGLRGGSFVAGDRWPRLRSVEFVPGVRVSGRTDKRGRLVVRLFGDAATRGTISLARDGRIRGRLGGRPISARLRARDPDLR